MTPKQPGKKGTKKQNPTKTGPMGAPLYWKNEGRCGKETP